MMRFNVFILYMIYRNIESFKIQYSKLMNFVFSFVFACGVIAGMQLRLNLVNLILLEY